MNLLGVCKIEINSLSLVQFKVQAGKQYTYDLLICPSKALAPEKSNTIEIHCNTDVIYPPAGKGQNIFTFKDTSKVS